MGQNWDIFLDAIEVFGGLYILFTGFDMKKNGTLTAYSLLGRNVELSKAPDPAGFIEAMYRIYIFCGTAFLIPGAVGFFLDNSGKMTTSVFLLLTAIMAVDIAVFSFFLLRAQKRYLIP